MQVQHPNKATCPDPSKNETLSVALHQAFPSQEDANILYKSCKGNPLYCYQINTRPLTKIKSEGLKLGKDPPEFLGPDTHPVLLARQMLIFALLIQESHTQHVEGLSEPPETIKKRLADTAISMVTTNEELHGTTEGIECIILEAVFQLCSGNLRRGWLAFRRALTVGQLMGIHRPHGPPLQRIDSSTKIDPQFMWIRIIYMDRILSMMLGFPQGTTDKSMASDSAMAGDSQMGKLVRSHAVIAARILELRDSDPMVQNPVPFREIDKDLLKLANSQPPKFWLPPNSISMDNGSGPYFWESVRVANQLVHYNLVCQLHLPNLLRSNRNQEDTCKYSKMACINASREILTRCVTYSGCSDFGGWSWIFAIPASMTLILAHIDSHRHQDFEHVLAHQRIGDRGMIEKILEDMEILKQAKHANGDVSSEKGENVLQWLLGIEAEAADGQTYSAQSVNEQEGFQEDDNGMRISIPYFGVVKFTREGRICKESPQARWLNERDNAVNETDATPSAPVESLKHVSNISGLPLDPVGINMGQVPHASAHTYPHPIDQHLAAQVPNASNHLNTQQQYSYPGLTAGIEDWAFQGVDNAFLDNLMMGTQHRDDGSNWLPDWQSENSGGV